MLTQKSNTIFRLPVHYKDFPQRNSSSRKRKPEEDPDDKGHDVKRRKEFESWEDLEELMRERFIRGNWRRVDEGPSNLFSNVWQEIWEDDLEEKHKRNFYRD